MIAVFSADTHVCDNVWRTRPSISGDSFFGFEQVVNWALRYQAPLVLAGDIVELMQPDTPTSKTVEVLGAGIQRCEAARVPVYYVRGNHDMSNPHWLSAINPYAVDVDQQVFELGGKACYGLGFKPADDLRELLASGPASVDGWIMHQQWSDLGQNSGAGQGSLVDVPGTGWILTGDLHQTVSKRVGAHAVYSPGATHMRSTAEPEKHCCMALTAEGRWLKLPLLSRPVFRLVASSVRQYEEALVDLRPQLIKTTQVYIDKHGCWPQVAIPLVLVEDRIHCHALVSAQAALGDVAHVIQINSLPVEVPTTVEASVELMATTPLEVSEATLAPLITRELESLDPLVQDVISQWLDGRPLEAIREKFLQA